MTHRLTESELLALCRDAFVYDSDTGYLLRSRTTSRHMAGDRADTLDRWSGYRIVSIGNEQHKAHRIAWLMFHGHLPAQTLDHKNMIKDDNRLCNLREATVQLNNQNVGKHPLNKSGFKGVHWHKYSKQFYAEIKVNKKHIHLGSFDNPEDANKAYCEASKKYHGEFGRAA